MTTRPKPSPVSATAAEPAEPACPSRPPPPRHPGRAQFVFILPNDSRSAKRVEEIVLARLTGLGYDEPSLFAVKLALEEAVSNAVRHGNRHHPARFVRVEFSADADAAELAVADEGCGFDPCGVPDPTAPRTWSCPAAGGSCSCGRS
jgi:serine/threonine-protein kinase RsbW